MRKVIKIDKETLDCVKLFKNEIRILQIKEKLDRTIGVDIYSDNLTDEQMAKLDYLLCEIEDFIHKNRDIIIQIEK